MQFTSKFEGQLEVLEKKIVVLKEQIGEEKLEIIRSKVSMGWKTLFDSSSGEFLYLIHPSSEDIKDFDEFIEKSLVEKSLTEDLYLSIPLKNIDLDALENDGILKNLEVQMIRERCY